MIQDILDEVLDTSLQPDVNPRYVIKDNNGKVINDNVQIDLKTPVVQNPTPLNKATLANIQGDLYTQDRYNVPAVGYDGTNYVFNIDLPLTSYESGKIVNLQGITFGDVTSFDNPYLNINNLGAKQINGTIVAGEKYSLVYNGENWDILPKDYVTGNYTGTTEVNLNGTQKITLGFRPKIVIVYCAEYGFVDLGADYWYGAIALDGYPALDGGYSGHPAYLTITDIGFEAKSTSSNARLNSSGFNYRYIAFK